MGNFIDIAGDVADTFFHQSKTVGTTRIQLNNDNTTKLTRGIQIRADGANTGLIYVGTAPVTANTNPESDGFPIAANEGIFLPIKHMDIVYVIATVAGQKLFWLAI